MSENHESGFSENHERVPATDFAWDEICEHLTQDERHLDAVRVLLNDRFSAAIRELIERLVDDDPTVEDLGKRIHRLAFKMGVSKSKTQAELAVKCGITQAAISMKLKSSLISSNGDSARENDRQSIFRP